MSAPHDNIRSALEEIAKFATDNGLTFEEARNRHGLKSLDRPKPRSRSYIVDRIPTRPPPVDYDLAYGTGQPGIYSQMSPGLWGANDPVYAGRPLMGKVHDRGQVAGYDRVTTGPPYSSQTGKFAPNGQKPARYRRGRRGRRQLVKVNYSRTASATAIQDGRTVRIRVLKVPL